MIARTIKEYASMLLLVLVLAISSSAFAQQKSPSKQSLENVIRNDFAKIKPEKLVDLVPFYLNGNWGYMDRNSMKVVVPARYTKLSFFNPTMDDGEYRGISFNVYSDGDVIIEEEERSYDEHVGVADISGKKVSVVSSADGYKGFSTDAFGKLISYSDIYQNYNFPMWNVSPFRWEGEYLAIVINKTSKMYGIIDVDGNTLPGFDFTYKDIAINRYAKGNDTTMWFFVQDSTENWSLKNITGELLFKSELFELPGHFTTYFGISILSKDRYFAVFDSYEQQWIQRPQAKVEFSQLSYSTENETVRTNEPSHREEAHIYYLVTEGKTKYYMDLEGRKYRPKK